jgi:hypothetical protein
MSQPTIEILRTLLADKDPPCVSLYQPTHRMQPERQQDSIRYDNLLRRMQDSLAAKYTAREITSFVARCEELANDSSCWNCRTESLAIVASVTRFEDFELQRSVPERIVVANSFHHRQDRAQRARRSRNGRSARHCT